MSALDIDDDEEDQSPPPLQLAKRGRATVPPEVAREELALRIQASKVPGAPPLSELMTMPIDAVVQLIVQYDASLAVDAAVRSRFRSFEELGRLPTLAQLSSLDYRDIQALCVASPVFEYVYCGGDRFSGSDELREAVAYYQLRSTNAMWLMLLRRDFGISYNADECSAPVPELRAIVAGSMEEAFPNAGDNSAVRIRTLARYYQKLHSARFGRLELTSAIAAAMGDNRQIVQAVAFAHGLFYALVYGALQPSALQMAPILHVLSPGGAFTDTQIGAVLARSGPTLNFRMRPDVQLAVMQVVGFHRDLRFGVGGRLDRRTFELTKAEFRQSRQLLFEDHFDTLQPALLLDAIGDNLSKRQFAQAERSDAAAYGTAVSRVLYRRGVIWVNDPAERRLDNLGAKLAFYVDLFDADDSIGSTRPFFLAVDYEYFAAPFVTGADGLFAFVLYRNAVVADYDLTADTSTRRFADYLLEKQLPGTLVLRRPLLDQPRGALFIWKAARVDEPGLPFSLAMLHVYRNEQQAAVTTTNERRYTYAFYITWVESRGSVGDTAHLRVTAVFKLQTPAPRPLTAANFRTTKLLGAKGAVVYRQRDLAIRFDLYQRRYAIAADPGYEPLVRDRYLSNALGTVKEEGELERLD